MAPAKPSKKQTATKQTATKKRNSAKVPAAARNHKTKIVVTCNCGFANTLYLRGEGIAGLSWDKGIQLKNVKADQWVWETTKNFNNAQIKVLLNDTQYETGENHKVVCGKSTNFAPKF